MKLHLLQCGTIRTKRHLIEGGPAGEEPFEVPVPFFLIEHEGSRVLFDTGNARAAIHASATGDYIPTMAEEDYVVNRLAQLGLRPGDITHVVLSHLHGDHAGGLEAFRNIPCYLQKAELRHAGAVPIEQRYPLDWRWLDGDYDLLGDGCIHILMTPGHSAGHQSLLLKQDDRGEVLLATDAAYTRVALDRKSLPVCTYDRNAALQTFDRIDAFRQSGVRIIYGHDPEQWAALTRGTQGDFC